MRKFLLGLISLVLIFGLINGGLWLYWKSVNSDENAEIDKLEKWLDETEVELKVLANEAENAVSQEEYDEFAEEYNALYEEYTSEIDNYNESIEVINDEFYLIPIPLGKKSR
jgi:hypothetical protein